MRRLLQMRFVATNLDWGLLLLRLSFGLSLFLNHGWEKTSNFTAVYNRFGDPIGVGGHFSMIFAMTSDAICSVLIGLGLATRWACAIIVINLTVAFVFVHHAKLQGPGEVAWLYLWAGVMLFLVGPGRYSIDGGPRGD